MTIRQISQDDLDPAEEYYALTLTTLGSSICLETAGSRWKDRADNGDEFREAQPYLDSTPWQLLKENWSKAEDQNDLIRVLASGGHCFVRREALSAWWPDFFSPIKCFRYCQEVPFMGSEYLPPGAEERHPIALIRRRVLARDEHQCRVCGYSPEDHSAVRLEIHHVIEFTSGGLTIEHNLITLCRKCHEMATPPDALLQNTLFEKIAIANGRFHRKNVSQGVLSYQSWTEKILGSKGMTPPSEPLEYLTMEDIDDRKRNAKWDYAYAMLAANTVAIYYTASEWRRILPAEFKRR